MKISPLMESASPLQPAIPAVARRHDLFTPSGVLNVGPGFIGICPTTPGFLRLRYFYFIARGDANHFNPLSVRVSSEAASVLFRVSLQALLGQIAVIPPVGRTALFDRLITFARRAHSLQGLESPFLSCLYAMGVQRQIPRFKLGVEIWNEFSTAEALKDTAAVPFVNTSTQVISFIGGAQLAGLGAGDVLVPGALMGDRMGELADSAGPDAANSLGGSGFCSGVWGFGTGITGALGAGAIGGVGGVLWGATYSFGMAVVGNQICSGNTSSILVPGQMSGGYTGTLTPNGFNVTTPDGGSISASSWTDSQGNTWTSVTTTDANGNVISQSGSVTDTSGNTVSWNTTTTTDNQGNTNTTTSYTNSTTDPQSGATTTSSTTTTTTTDSNGNVTSSSTTVTTTTTNSDGSSTTTTTTTDNNNPNPPDTQNNEPNGDDINTGPRPHGGVQLGGIVATSSLVMAPGSTFATSPGSTAFISQVGASSFAMEGLP